MNDDPIQLGDRFRETLLDVLRESDRREPLREAAANEDLKTWTALLTHAVVTTCRTLGWQAAAKGHKLELLPQTGQEYLGMDAMAFDPAAGQPDAKWHWPVAVMDLENARDRVGYSLWKVLNVAAPLRVVVGYRGDWDTANALPGLLTSEVMQSMPMDRWSKLEGETMLVIGSRSDGASFPWGYFRFWQFDRGVGRFVRAGG